MDANGARQLQKRLEAHEHWCQAEAVRDGRQPSTDPDVLEFIEIRDGVRHYREGLTKTLVDGAWETSRVQDDLAYGA